MSSNGGTPSASPQPPPGSTSPAAMEQPKNGSQAISPDQFLADEDEQLMVGGGQQGFIPMEMPAVPKSQPPQHHSQVQHQPGMEDFLNELEQKNTTTTNFISPAPVSSSEQLASSPTANPAGVTGDDLGQIMDDQQTDIKSGHEAPSSLMTMVDSGSLRPDSRTEPLIEQTIVEEPTPHEQEEEEEEDWMKGEHDGDGTFDSQMQSSKPSDNHPVNPEPLVLDGNLIYQHEFDGQPTVMDQGPFESKMPMDENMMLTMDPNYGSASPTQQQQPPHQIQEQQHHQNSFPGHLEDDHHRPEMDYGFTSSAPLPSEAVQQQLLAQYESEQDDDPFGIGQHQTTGLSTDFTEIPPLSADDPSLVAGVGGGLLDFEPGRLSPSLETAQEHYAQMPEEPASEKFIIEDDEEEEEEQPVRRSADGGPATDGGIAMMAKEQEEEDAEGLQMDRPFGVTGFGMPGAGIQPLDDDLLISRAMATAMSSQLMGAGGGGFGGGPDPVHDATGFSGLAADLAAEREELGGGGAIEADRYCSNSGGTGGVVLEKEVVEVEEEELTTHLANEADPNLDWKADQEQHEQYEQKQHQAPSPLESISSFPIPTDPSTTTFVEQQQQQELDEPSSHYRSEHTQPLEPQEAPINTRSQLLFDRDEEVTSADYSMAKRNSPDKAEVSSSSGGGGVKADGEAGDCPFAPSAWFKADQLHPIVSELIFWKDPKKSGIVFGIGLVILLSLACCSIISVVAYTSLAALSSTLGFRIYKTILGAVQKTSEGHPFQEYLEVDVQPSNTRVHEIVDVLLNHYSCTAKKLRGVFLVEDIIDSLKFVGLFWCLTYIGSWFNGMTLVILAYLAAFSVPKLYDMNKAQVDQYLELASSHIQNLVSKVRAVIPFPSVKKEKDKTQ